jgi:Ca2+-binding EF-hand superfamily protein
MVRDFPMISRRTLLHTLATATLVGIPVAAFGKSGRSSAVQMLDTDNDGTVDLMEAKKAASALFDRLDRDHDGTLDKRELAGRLSAKELAAADPDHDGTLTKDEYLAIVEQRFNAANADNDGTLDAKELTTKAGQKLMRLLK